MFSFSPVEIITLVVVFLIALSFHEAAHAFVAYKLGDPTAKHEGRLTLNPSAHLDLVGTLAIFLVHFGWGKPVPVSQEFFEKPRRDMALVALAGPATNIFLAFVSLALLFTLTSFMPESLPSILARFLETMAIINALLGVFNLFPLPPLDGGNILLGILPIDLVPQARHFLMTHGMIVFFILIGIEIFFRIPLIFAASWSMALGILDFFELLLAPLFIDSSAEIPL